MTTLGQISGLFGPSQVVRLTGWGRGGLAALMEPVVDLVMSLMSSVFWAAHLGLLAVLLRDSQRREYLADQRAADLAGPRATAQLMDLLDADLDSVVASRARAQQIQEGWREAATDLLAPHRTAKLHRLRQLSTRTDVSLWTTHPPAGLRAWLVEARPVGSAALVLTEAESRQIDAELSGYYQRARRDLAQSGV
jgi:Zn-dependent protease with chaperone function